MPPVDKSYDFLEKSLSSDGRSCSWCFLSEFRCANGDDIVCRAKLICDVG